MTIPQLGVYANYILSPDEMTSFYDEPTLLRSILRWVAVTSSAPTSGQDWFFGWGLIQLDFELPGGTIAGTYAPALPLPYFDADSEWIYTWYQTVVSGSVLNGGFGATANGVGMEDIRTRRRFQNGKGLALIAYYDGFASNLFCQFSGRLLFANH